MPKVGETNARLRRIAEHFDDYQKNGDGYTALCPAHDDTTPSLSINKGNDGKILVHCHAGCKTADILEAADLSFADLKPTSGKHVDKSTGKIVDTYNYTDEHGKLLYQVCRKVPKAFLQRRQKPSGDWIWSIKGVRRVPYRLAQLMAAALTSIVFIVEGEKDVDRLVKLGLVATCNSGGADSGKGEKWLAEFNQFFRGRQVVILPDNDEPGRNHAQHVAKTLQGVAASVKILDLPGLPDHGDVSDWLNRGGIKKKLLTLARRATKTEISASTTNADKKQASRTPFAQYIAGKWRSGTDDVVIGSVPAVPGKTTGDVQAGSMVDIMKKVDGIRYLVRGWVPFGMLTMLLAPPGFGKSAFALYGLVRTIVTGGLLWFNGMKGPSKPGNVLWCDTEGSSAITVQRIRDWGLSPERILVPFEDDPLMPINLTSFEHLERIEALIDRHHIKLVVIDSLRGAHGGDENSSQVAQVLQSLATIAERTKAAIVIVHHTRKMAIDEEMHADLSRGSNAIVAMVRSQLGIDRPDKGSDWCCLQMLKENLGLKPRPVGFRISDKGLEFGAAPEKPRKKTDKDIAADWLQRRMRRGKVYKAFDLLAEAKEQGYAERTVRKAATERLKIVPQPVRKKGKVVEWTWELPAR